ncbi:three component ABC system middle component [Paenibacillus sp. TAF43_2]|uniref:three component ABC system middle component n=1 Tax=Paenibacillus sp. TAF43_2 TaxID=3233069 RepID=UPI003F9E2D1C
MENIHEYEVVQNVAIGALALWTFSVEYYKTLEENRGPDLAVSMLVLPLIFNEDFVKKAYRRNFKGGLFNSLNEDKTLFLGMQERMESMASLTLKSLNICFSAKLIFYDHVRHEYLPIRMNVPQNNGNSDIKDILATAKRLGYWFSTIDFNELCALIKVRY